MEGRLCLFEFCLLKCFGSIPVGEADCWTIITSSYSIIKLSYSDVVYVYTHSEFRRSLKVISRLSIDTQFLI